VGWRKRRTFQLGLVRHIKFICEFLVGEGVTKVVSVRFEGILCGDMSCCRLTLSCRKPPAILIQSNQSNIKKKVLTLLRGVKSSLDSGTNGDSLVRVDDLVGLLAIEEIGDKLHDTRDTSETGDQSILESQRAFSTGPGLRVQRRRFWNEHW
jgi:hypothetical protein